MSLNVKDPEAHRLAQAIAQATGETMTRAVTEALRERYERLQRRDPETLAADIRAIAKRAAAHIKRPYLDHAELLYDEHGLPKCLPIPSKGAVALGRLDGLKGGKARTAKLTAEQRRELARKAVKRQVGQGQEKAQQKDLHDKT
jgi:antitoxin VapB